jgi:hypothetical protein
MLLLFQTKLIKNKNKHIISYIMKGMQIKLIIAITIFITIIMGKKLQTVHQTNLRAD